MHLRAHVSSTKEQATGVLSMADQIDIVVKHRHNGIARNYHFRVSGRSYETTGAMVVNFRRVLPDGSTRVLQRLDLSQDDAHLNRRHEFEWCYDDEMCKQCRLPKDHKIHEVFKL